MSVQLPTEMPRRVAFRDAQWKTRWLVVGLAALLGWRCLAVIEASWLAQFPWWILLLLTGFAPQLFLLIFPFVTRTPRTATTLGLPTPSRFLVELAIAVPAVLGMMAAMVVGQYALTRAFPEASLNPEAMSNMSFSPNRAYVGAILLFSFTFAPIAEEVFFRGFLHNALRARAPIVVAFVAQCLIFGFAHFFGIVHAAASAVLGVFLTALYEWRKTLVTPILAHAGVNFVWALGTALMMLLHANSPVMGVVGDYNDAQCVIRQVMPDSAAENVGLQVGDIITSFDGEPIRDFRHLMETTGFYSPGDEVSVTFNRNGSAFEVTVVLRARGSP